MIPLTTLALFFAAAVAVGLAPGPDNIFVLTQSALHGRAAGLLVTLGLCTGLLVHTAAVSLGVAAVFQTSATAFSLLKAVGAVYLLYLAWHAFKAGPGEVTGQVAAVPGSRALCIRGVLMNVTNPKVDIFFLAFLPQFTEPSRGSVTAQLFLLGAIFMVATLIIFGLIASAAGFLGEWIKRSAHAQVMLNRIAGTVFMALAISLAAGSAR